MTKALYALPAIAAVALLVPSPATALEYPFCIKGCDFAGGRGDCSFSSYQQCQATASGRDATCAVNPYFNANAEQQPNRGPQSRRRF